MEGSEGSACLVWAVVESDAGQDLYVCRRSCRGRCQFSAENQTKRKHWALSW